MGLADVFTALAKAAGKTGDDITTAAADFAKGFQPGSTAKLADLLKLAKDAGIQLTKADEAIFKLMKENQAIDPKLLESGSDVGKQLVGKHADDLIVTAIKDGKSAADAGPFAKSVISGGADNAKLLGDMTAKGPGAVGDAMAKSKSWWDKLPEATKGILVKAGIGAAAVGAVMLITGESDPAKAIGDQAGKLAGAAGAAVGEGLGAAGKGFFGGSGLGDFFSKWGIYIGGFFACILLLYLFSMFTKKR
jgi:hypothetical protein